MEALEIVTDFMSNLETYIETFLNSVGFFGAILAALLITVESILPVLPICVFITLVFLSFGNFWGFIISWLFTCLGCVLSFLLFRSKVKGWVERKLLKNNKKAKKLLTYIDKMKLSSLAVLVAVPFTPASAINIAAGLSNMSFKKFLYAIMIGKLFMVYFWGYIGTTLIESITHPVHLVKIIIMLFAAFIISKLVNKYMNIE